MTWLVGNKLVTITTSGGSRTQALLGLDMAERPGGGGEMTRLQTFQHIGHPVACTDLRRGRGQAALRGHNHGLGWRGVVPLLEIEHRSV